MRRSIPRFPPPTEVADISVEVARQLCSSDKTKVKVVGWATIKSSSMDRLSVVMNSNDRSYNMGPTVDSNNAGMGTYLQKDQLRKGKWTVVVQLH